MPLFHFGNCLALACGPILLTYKYSGLFLPLWVGARGIEFDWKYIQMSLDSNVALVHHLSVAMLIWLRTRNDLSKSYIPLINVLLILCCYRPLILEVLVHAFGLGTWIHLLSRFLFTILVGLPTLQLYLSLPNNN
ncbi:unnamed protein product [Rotaria magnacalcarata]|uniref:BOS complex subunit TMEM147 n=1 Tax=Rotaria magnacalcarata TaxID=392030 RepID=A0A8S2R103_9BILA|nr:unnamed protein product [Rotaria magnacalcarata]